MVSILGKSRPFQRILVTFYWIYSESQLQILVTCGNIIRPGFSSTQRIIRSNRLAYLDGSVLRIGSDRNVWHGRLNQTCLRSPAPQSYRREFAGNQR